MRLRGMLLIAAAALLGAGAAVPAAYAANAYDPPQIISATPQVQGSAATKSIALTPDGRYAVVLTSAKNLFPAKDPVSGQATADAILRYDLDAPGSAPDVVALGLPGATNTFTFGTEPSVSADGRWVSFASWRKLAPTDANAASDVYVRDMSAPITDPAAFTQATLKDGGDTPIRYGTGVTSIVTRNALSDDGTKVVYEVRSTSDVGRDDTKTITPIQQVVLRDLSTKATTVVSVDTSGAPSVPVGLTAPPLPVISGDGSVVAWQTRNAFEKGSPIGVVKTFAKGSDTNVSTNRLNAVWRRVSDGAAAKTTLVTGGVDLADPRCNAANPRVSFTEAPGPCDGPLLDNNNEGVQRIALSRDGREAAVTAADPRKDSSAPGNGYDLYVVDSAAGSTLKQQTRRITFGLTRAAGASAFDVEMSRDGRYVAFSASAFQAGASPVAVGPIPPPIAGTRYPFLVDLEQDTVRLLGESWTGDAPDGPTTGIALSDDARRIGLISSATNLFFGDLNGAPDAFILNRSKDAAGGEGPLAEQALPSILPPALPEVGPTPDWRLSVTATRRADGTVQLSNVVPGAGTLAARTTERVVVSGGGAKGKKAKAKAPKTVAPPVTAATSGAGTTRLLVTPSKKYAKLAKRGSGLPATVTVTFTPAAGGTPLTRTLAITFKRSKAPAATPKGAR